MGEASGAKVRFVTVDAEHAGQRIDNYLLRELKGVPKTWVYRVLRKGEVRVNKGRAKPDRRLVAGDVVRIPPVRTGAGGGQPVGAAPAPDIERSILFEDAELLVLNKPPGVAVHGGSGLAHGVIERLRHARPQAAYLELAHRLDRETSGCLLLAKKRAALLRFQEAQTAGRVGKHYLALLDGRIRRGRFRVDAPLRKNTLQGGERVVRVDPEGKAAATRFAVQERFAAACLVDATLETGRTHQIRVHAAHAGHPILGDPKYGSPEANRRARDAGLRRLFLHAARLEIPWPGRRQARVFEAPLPAELVRVLENLRKA